MSPWVRVDEYALNHVKVKALSNGAFRLWVEGLAYCQRNLTDGRLSREALRTFDYHNRTRVDELTRMVDNQPPLWEPTEIGFQVHNYLKWNESREHVLAVRELAKTRLERHRKRVANAVRSDVHNHIHNHKRSKDQERYGRVFDGERLKVSRKQLDSIVAEMGDQAAHVDWMALLPKWDAELIASGEDFNTLNYLRDKGGAVVKALRSSGALMQGSDWCHHDPRCHSPVWHQAVIARERGEAV